ncbi:MAG TPA: M67 family metallopeptidase [Candidatus Limnocylindrales bacterium]
MTLTTRWRAGSAGGDEAVLSDPEAYYPGAGGRTHPGPRSVTLPAAIRDGIVDQARREVPNEACGIVVGGRSAADGGVALRWAPLRNQLASPFRYAIEPDDLLRLTIETDDADEVFWAIVHSHVASPARPSPTDLRESHYPEALYLLVSLDPAEADAATGAPSLRGWRIVDGGVHEVEVRIDA